jgi:hypothetical protein
MNDETTSYGMAAVVTIKDGQAQYRLMRNKQMTPAEKAEAAKLAPPKRDTAANEAAPQEKK